MRSHRLLALGPADEALWVRLYVYPVGDQWASAIVADGVTQPGPDEAKGIGFYTETPDEAERLAKAYLGMSEPAN
jgi:hypothetical protein